MTAALADRLTENPARADWVSDAGPSGAAPLISDARGTPYLWFDDGSSAWASSGKLR